jgi:hypothetical protein
MLDELYIVNSSTDITSIWHNAENKTAIDSTEKFIIIFLLLQDNDFKYNSAIRNKISELSLKHRNFVKKEVDSSIKYTKEILSKSMFKSAQKSLENDYMQTYKPNDDKEPNLRQNKELMDIVSKEYTKAVKELNAITNYLPDVAQKSFMLNCETASANLIADIIKQTAENGLSSMFGLRKSLISADIKRVVQTVINRTAGNITLAYALQVGYEYVLVSGHVGARWHATIKTWSHIEWQGTIYKIKGKDKDIENLKTVTGFPTDPGGLLGWNCRHSFAPHKLGMPNPYKNFTDKDYSDVYKRISYQRTQEKIIRQTRRELECLTTADKKLNNQKVKESIYTTKTKLARQLSNYKKYCAKYNLKVSDYNLNTR